MSIVQPDWRAGLGTDGDFCAHAKIKKRAETTVCKATLCVLSALLLALAGGCGGAPTVAKTTTGTVRPTPATQPSAQPPAPSPRVQSAEPVTVGKADIIVAGVGDIMLGGTAGPELERLGYDYPFVYMKPLWADSALVFGNLEGPLTDRAEGKAEKQYVFRSPPDRVTQALVAAGIRAVSLANNHTLDYGADGLVDTIGALEAAGIAHAGAGRDSARARAPAFIDVAGKRVALLAYSATLPEEFFAGATTPGTAFAHEAHVRADVAAARARADVVLVSFHWGREGSTELRDYQVKLGHAAIEAGAHAVLGHHPHILQGVELYRDGVILYSLGNFVFGSYSKTATRSMIAKLHFVADDGAGGRGSKPAMRLRKVELLPINVDNVALNFQPLPLTGADADAVIATLGQLSQPLATEIRNDNGRGRIDVLH